MNLYFIACENEDDENLDLFMQAPNTEIAWAMTREYWAHEWGQDPDAYSGAILPDAPDGPDVEVAARIFEVVPNGIRTGALDWASTDGIGGDCMFRGHVLP